MKTRSHWLWRRYENVTALIGWLAILALPLFLWNTFAPVIDLPTLLPEYNNWIGTYLLGAVGWIVKADFIKYRITKDPRDEPGRKWGSFKHAQRFLPGERVWVNRPAEEGAEQRFGICPTCNHTHGFHPEDETPRACGVYGCKGTVMPIEDPAKAA